MNDTLDLKFKPWISENYKNGTSKYNRLLILGESHYTTDIKTYDEFQKDEIIETLQDTQVLEKSNLIGNFTSEVIEDFINNKYNYPFFRNLGNLFNQNDYTEVWNHVAFANGIQSLLYGANTQPNKKDIETVKESFWKLLSGLQPNKIIVCSQRMWNYWLPDEDKRGCFMGHYNKGEKTSTIWKYEYDKVKCFAMAINHPSKYFSYLKWRPIVTSFIQEEF